MSQIKIVDDKQNSSRRSSGKSKVTFPYYNLNQSIKVAEMVWSLGGGSCTRDQMASFLNYSTTRSGAFLMRIYAAKMFGLIDIAKDNIAVTEQAKKIITPVMPDDAIRAKIEAFLGAPLFNKIYQEFKGNYIGELTKKPLDFLNRWLAVRSVQLHLELAVSVFTARLRRPLMLDRFHAQQCTCSRV